MTESHLPCQACQLRKLAKNLTLTYFASDQVVSPRVVPLHTKTRTGTILDVSLAIMTPPVAEL